MENSVSQSKHILIAEDEKAYCRALVLKLQKVGFTVESVSDGHAAIEILQTKKFDLLLLDLVMPHMSGFEVLESIRTLKIEIKSIIVLTNLTQSEDKDKVKQFGVKDFIEKADTSIVDIVNRVENLLQ